MTLELEQTKITGLDCLEIITLATLVSSRIDQCEEFIRRFYGESEMAETVRMCRADVARFRLLYEKLKDNF